MPLFQIRVFMDDAARCYDMSPDGKRFIVAQPVEGEDAPITVIYNWPKLLEDR